MKNTKKEPQAKPEPQAPPPVLVEYKVVRPFKYGGRKLKRGDIWQPSGSRNDRLIAAGRNVRRVETEVTSEVKDEQ